MRLLPLNSVNTIKETVSDGKMREKPPPFVRFARDIAGVAHFKLRQFAEPTIKTCTDYYSFELLETVQKKNAVTRE